MIKMPKPNWNKMVWLRNHGHQVSKANKASGFVWCLKKALCIWRICDVGQSKSGPFDVHRDFMSGTSWPLQTFWQVTVINPSLKMDRLVNTVSTGLRNIESADMFIHSDGQTNLMLMLPTNETIKSSGQACDPLIMRSLDKNDVPMKVSCQLLNLVALASQDEIPE